MTYFKRFVKIMLYADADKTDYYRVRHSIIESNRRALVLFTCVAITLISALYVLSFVLPIIESSRSSYIACVIGSLALFIIAIGPAKRHRNCTIVAMYCFSALLMGIGIAFGTIVEPNRASVSFAVLMFATPLLFTDIPIRTCLMTILGIVLYIIAATYTQDADMLAFNKSVVIPYGVISLIITTYLMKMKVRSVILQDKSLELEAIKELNLQLEEKKSQLQDAHDSAKAANDAKTTFLFNMSHDIRTPMNAILGFSELLENEKDNPQRVSDYISKIKNSGDYLLSLINNVLDMARIESGKVEVDEEFFDMLAPENNANILFEEMAKKKHISLTYTNNIQHRYVRLDKTKVHQIIVNLLSNAVKYTPEGGTICYYFNEIPSEREGFAKFESVVKDNGIGMSPKFAEHIFDVFSRERTTTISKVNGSGLGMSIVKKLVDLMGGTITVDTELGKGTTITVSMYHPIIDDPEKFLEQERHQEEKSSVLLSGRRVLLAEDNELNAEIVITILENHGIKVEHAEDGVECLKMVNNAESGYYDAILMDIQMPNLNGYDAALRIRQLTDKSKATIPILAMTANAFDEDKKKALESGMNGHLSKPINVSELLKTLSMIIVN